MVSSERHRDTISDVESQVFTPNNHAWSVKWYRYIYIKHTYFIVQRFIRTASSNWYVLMLTAYMSQGRLAQCSILQAYHYISLIMNTIGNKHY